MPESNGNKVDQVSLARIHAVLGIVSAGMIGQIISVDHLSPLLRSAVWWFGTSLLLNVFLYVLESDAYSPRIYSVFFTCVFMIISSGAILVNLFAFCQVLNHLAPPSGHYFLFTGFALYIFLMMNSFRNRRRSWSEARNRLAGQTSPVQVQFFELAKIRNELKQLLDAQMKHGETTEDDNPDRLSLQKAIDELKAKLNIKTEEVVAEFKLHLSNLHRAEHDYHSFFPKIVRAGGTTVRDATN